MDHEVHQASGGRSPDASPDPKMVEGWSFRRWPVVGDENGYAAGGSGFTADRQRVPHYLFDLWADVWRRKVAQGDVIVVRYADDLVVGFQHRMDAERFLREFRERL